MEFIVMLLSFHQFGIEPDTGANTTEALVRLFAELEKLPPDTPITLAMEKGRYDFYEEYATEKICYISNHDQENPKRRIAFLFENKNHITIDGCGSKFVFHGIIIPFAFLNSHEIVLKNLSLDYECPQIHQFRILEADAGTVVGIVESHEKPIIRDGPILSFSGERNPELPVSSFLTFEENGHMAWNLADSVFQPDKIEELDAGTLRISGLNPQVRKGMVLAFRSGRRPAPGLFLDRADDFHAENVNIHYSYGMGILAQHTRNIHLDGFRVCRPDGINGRLFTTEADASHFVGCSGIIRSENGLYEGMTDDAINVHGVYLRVLERENEHTIRVSFMHNQCFGIDWGGQGETISLIQSNTMEYLPGTWTLRSVRILNLHELELETEEVLPEFQDDLKYGVENLTRTPEVHFCHNIVRDNRARGALFSTPRHVLCQNNFFDHSHGSAILLCGDCNGWYESGACRDVVIRNNRFLNCLTALYQFTEAIISVCPKIPALKQQKSCFHSGICIENNLFETFDHPILFLMSAENVVFRGNQIIYNNDYQPFHPNQESIILRNVRDFYTDLDLGIKNVPGRVQNR